MRIGFVGPADGDEALLREAAEFLLGDATAETVVYLGLDDTVDRMVEAWARDVAGPAATETGFLDRVVAVATTGDAEAIEHLLRRDRAVADLGRIRKLPPPPARAIEMIENRIVTVVHDKAILDAEDIANSSLVVYGKSDEALLKRFGPRYFFTPGPLRSERVGIIDVEKEGLITVALFEPSGAPVWREVLQGRRAPKMMVSS